MYIYEVKKIIYIKEKTGEKQKKRHLKNVHSFVTPKAPEDIRIVSPCSYHCYTTRSTFIQSLEVWLLPGHGFRKVLFRQARHIRLLARCLSSGFDDVCHHGQQLVHLLSVNIRTRTHTHAHARSHAQTHTRAHARARAQVCALARVDRNHDGRKILLKNVLKRKPSHLISEILLAGLDRIILTSFPVILKYLINKSFIASLFHNYFL